MNNQPITKQDLSRDGVLRPFLVKEIFTSIQGEGLLTGHSATFIRFGGCNLKCTWCDTEYSENLQELMIEEIIAKIPQFPSLIVITGGEPFLQNISDLVKTLIVNGFTVQIETNGTLTNPKFPWKDTFIVCSPKAGKLHEDIVQNVGHYKYVVGVEDKGCVNGIPNTKTQERAGTPQQPDEKTPVYLMPKDGETPEEQKANEIVTQHIVMSHPNRILSLRVHKILGVR
jgi:7-carboxy-7-deazaguanine synthase